MPRRRVNPEAAAPVESSGPHLTIRGFTNVDLAVNEERLPDTFAMGQFDCSSPRPYLEDEGGILPVHMVGLQAAGTLHGRVIAFKYSLGLFATAGRGGRSLRPLPGGVHVLTMRARLALPLAILGLAAAAEGGDVAIVMHRNHPQEALSMTELARVFVKALVIEGRRPGEPGYPLAR